MSPEMLEEVLMKWSGECLNSRRPIIIASAVIIMIIII